MQLKHVAESQATVYKITCCDCQATFTGETRRVMNVWLTELKRPLEIVSLILGPLNNQDDNSDICTSSNEKQGFFTACKMLSHYHTFHYRSRLINDVKWPILQWCGRLEHLKSFQLFILKPKAFLLIQFQASFSRKTTQNNREIIAKTRSYFLRWSSRGGQRRPNNIAEHHFKTEHTNDWRCVMKHQLQCHFCCHFSFVFVN